MSVLHVYPFDVGATNGGTMRLRMAVSACPGGVVRFSDRDGWQLHDLADVVVGADASVLPNWKSPKRRLFPTTLWESGARRRRSLASVLRSPGARDSDAVVLHTSYLGSVASSARRLLDRPVLVDVYDLVWRAHLLDARGSPALGTLRRSYAATVRLRETRSIRKAAALLFAGWGDAALTGQPLAWAPTGIEPVPHSDRLRSDEVRVGFIGNFHHWATREAAERLIASPLRSEGARIVLAGHGSRQFAADLPRVQSLGRISSVRELYDAVDCVAVPAMAGAGMKVKVAEAAVSRVPVVTTPIGADGFPPALREALTIVAVDRLDLDACRRAMKSETVDACASAFADLEWTNAVATYGRLVGATQ